MSRDDFKEDDFDDSEKELNFEDDETEDLFDDKPEPEEPTEPFDSGRESDRRADGHFASRLGYR